MKIKFYDIKSLDSILKLSEKELRELLNQYAYYRKLKIVVENINEPNIIIHNQLLKRLSILVETNSKISDYFNEIALKVIKR